MQITHGLVKGGHWTGSSVFYLDFERNEDFSAFQEDLKDAFQKTNQPVGIYVRFPNTDKPEELLEVLMLVKGLSQSIQTIVEIDVLSSFPDVWCDYADWVIYKGSVGDTIPAGVNEAQLAWGETENTSMRYLPRRLWGKVLVYVQPRTKGTLNKLFDWMQKQVVPIKLIPYGQDQ